jgi:fatty-acyl-CoA synthase
MADSSVPWVEGLTIGAILRKTAARFPEHDALVFPQFDVRMNYRQFDAEVDRAARALLALGIQKGEHVALWATNWPQWVLLQFATARIGAVLVTINPAYRSHELAYVLKQSDSVALFLIDKFRNSDYFAMVAEAVPELGQTRTGKLNSSQYPKLRDVVALTDSPAAGTHGWNAFLKLAEQVSGEQLHAREEELAPGDPINIQYTQRGHADAPEPDS